MLPEIVAMFSAMGWAGDSIFIRLGVRKSSIFVAMFLSFLVSSTCITAYLVASRSLFLFKSPAILYFVVSGCVQPLPARAFFYTGITRLGVSRAGPPRGAEPLFAAVIAVTVLNERPGLWVYLGTVLIMASLWLISGRQAGDTKWRLLDTAFPLGATLISAISQTLRKQGLRILPNPFVASVTVTLTSLTLLSIFLLITKRTQLLRMERPSVFFFHCRLLGHRGSNLQFHRLGARRGFRHHSITEHDPALHRVFHRHVLEKS
jgi:uncharacterized membrane protein